MFSNIDWSKGDNDFYAERSIKIKNDQVKSFLLLPKFVLQMINAWPETRTLITITLRYIGIFLLSTLLILNAWYTYDVSDDMTQAALNFTAFNVGLQALSRIVVLTIYQNEFAEVLAIVWKQFWSINILPRHQYRSITKTSKRYFVMIVIYVIGSIGTNAAYTFEPMFTGRREFSVNPKLPSSFYTSSPNYELTFVCLSFLTTLLICAPYAAFDTLYCGLVYNCSVQFKMLRLHLNDLIEEEEAQNERCEFQEQKVKQLVELIQHHKLVIRTCKKLKKVFRYFLLVQLIQSGIQICFCTFAGMVSDVVVQMGILSCTSILQLFLYCSFGNELTYQSQTIAYGAFKSGWHFLHHKKLSKMLILLMHKSQLGEELTANGFTAVNYSTFLAVLRATFSFYTALRVMLDKIQV